jgi:ribose-phosphate pyrophosphokinase
MNRYKVMNGIGREIQYTKIEFSDGTHNILIDTPKEELFENGDILITVPAVCPDGFDTVLWDLLLLEKALEGTYNSYRIDVKISLIFEYLPNARADRRFTANSTTPLKVFANAIEELINPVKVYVVAPHNADALPSQWLVDNVTPYKKLLSGVEHDVVVFPDKGAAGRFKDLTKKPVVIFDKVRNVEDGKVVGTKIESAVGVIQAEKPLQFVILDDICDGGRTFTECAKELRKEYPDCHITLCVAHGIFSKGLGVFKGLINRVEACNIVGSYTTRVDIATFNHISKSK